VTIVFKTIRKLVGIILSWDEVKRRALCDALDKCCGNYLLAARLLGIGRITSLGWRGCTTITHPWCQGRGYAATSR
jgi:hypothetical protein